MRGWIGPFLPIKFKTSGWRENGATVPEPGFLHNFSEMGLAGGQVTIFVVWEKPLRVWGQGEARGCIWAPGMGMFGDPVGRAPHPDPWGEQQGRPEHVIPSLDAGL